MKTAIFICIICVMIDFMMIGLTAALCMDKFAYSHGMVFGVHIPKEAAEGEEIQGILKKRKKQYTRFMLWNLLASVLVLIPAFWYTSVFFILYSLWIAEYAAGLTGFFSKCQRSLYRLKTARGWSGGAPAGTVLIDTAVTARGERLAFSHWLHAPAVLISAGCAAAAIWKHGPWETADRAVAVTLAAASLLFWGLHGWLVRRGGKVYSENGSVNRRMNQAAKRGISGGLLGASWLNTAGLAGYMAALWQGRTPDIGNIFWLLAFGTLSAGALVAGLVLAGKKQREIAETDTQEIAVDDDYYWRTGWYCNPDDRRLWVQGRVFDANYGLNMGHPAAKKICAAMGVLFLGIIVFMIWLGVMLLRIDFTEIGLAVGTETVQVEAGMYEISFAREEIRELALVDALPDERMRRTNGSADDRLLLGNFKGDTSGPCKLYVYRGYSPILKITLPEYTVYINSRTEGTAQKWYEELGG